VDLRSWPDTRLKAVRHAFLNCSAERLKEDFTRQLLRGVYVTRSSRDLRVTFDLVIKELGNGNTVMTKGVFMQFRRLLQPNTEPMSDQDLHWVWSYCDTNTSHKAFNLYIPNLSAVRSSSGTSVSKHLKLPL
jgi:hypothetical protein